MLEQRIQSGRISPSDTIGLVPCYRSEPLDHGGIYGVVREAMSEGPNSMYLSRYPNLSLSQSLPVRDARPHLPSTSL